MKISLLNYVLIGISVFVLTFIVQMIVVPRFVPTPTVEDFNHPSEVTGTYRYYRASRGASTTWVNDMAFYCEAGALSFHTCFERIETLPKGALITVEIVDLKMTHGHIPMAMSIKSPGTEVFSQTPIQCINAWRADNNYWFSGFSLILASLVTGFTHIFLTTGNNKPT
jgi:hypothetical protein